MPSAGPAGFAALSATALASARLAARLGIPGAALMVCIGVVAGAAGHLRPPFAFGPAVFFVFLPPLIFEAAWNLDLAVLRATWRPIVLLAFPGTLVVAFAIGGGLAALGALPFGAALLYGAIVAATDPVAVVAAFRTCAVPLRVRTIVEAESIANDGVAVVLFAAALAAATGGRVDRVAAVAHGALAIGGGALLGVALASCARAMLRFAPAAGFAVPTTAALAYVAYLVADRLGLSGIFACAAAGVVLRARRGEDGGAGVDVAAVDRFWTATADVANAATFVATGMLIDVPRLLHEPFLVAAALAIVFVSRAAIVAVVLRDARAATTALLAGMRGALPLALALSLPSTLPHRAEIIDAVFATVVATLVLQGVPLTAAIRRLYPAEDAG